MLRRVKKRRRVLSYRRKKIARLTIKVEKRPAQSLAKSSESKEKERASVQSEAFDKEVHSKKAVNSRMVGLQT